MADIADDLQNIKFIFQQSEKPTAGNIDCYSERKSIYLGETVWLYVVISRETNAEERWKSRICQVAASGNFSKIDETTKLKFKSPKKTPVKSPNTFTVCPVAVTLSEHSLTSEYNLENKDFKPYFIDDKNYLVPVKACLSSMDGYINRVNLNVSVWMCTSPLDQTPDQIAKKDFHLDNLTLQVLKKKTVQQKTVSKELNVINPPLFKIKVTTAGGKHLLLVHVCNKSNESVELIDLNILNTSSKYSVEESGSHVLDIGNNNNLSSEHITSRIHFNKLGSTNLPCSLLPEEEMSFIFNLSLESFNSSISELELYFKSQLKWRHSSSVTNVITVYRLPKFCVRYAPFIISIGCSENITVGKSFTLTYNIVNKLQDFLSMKLYWSLKHQLEVARQKGDNDGNRQRLEMMNRAVICHDPDIYVGACPRGSSVPVPVSFQILEPGLFEFSDLMKVNLRYALPDSQSTLKQDSLGTPVSLDTTSTLSTEDQLAASEELWRDRSGSTSSLNTPTSESAEEKRKSFATKSYSFGDLGPTLSTDSDEARRKRFKNIKRSSAVPPPRPPPPRLLTQVEKDVTNPSNFLKKSFQVYIPHHV